VRFTPADRALLAALLRRPRPQTLGRMRLLVRPCSTPETLRPGVTWDDRWSCWFV
jgi:hypothetical protein